MAYLRCNVQNKVKIQEFNTIIIGAGPAGLFASIHRKGGKVLLIEKKPSAGRKLLIAGQGRCNLTHEGSISAFMSRYGNANKFLKNALYGFDNIKLIEFFHNHGLGTVVDKNGKVFPETERSVDVLKVLLDACIKARVRLLADEPVLKVERINEKFTIQTANSIYTSRFLMIATGGLSYPATGSSGDGYRFATDLGHSLEPQVPALSPVFIRDFTMSELAGVSLAQRSISIYRQNRKFAEHRGDIGITHKGLSGPGILDFSRHMQAGDLLKINMIDTNADEFRNAIIAQASQSGKQEIQTFLKSFELPKSLLRFLLEELQISHSMPLAMLTKDKRIQLIASLCEYPFLIDRVGGYNMAMATHGGVKLTEVSPKTMESKLVPGLYFAGEVLDVDGDTGGYNLQAAFSTAYLAANSMNAKV
ncbi:MAG: NAD(P)/FAD-dependent oxidoreductase [Bacteroidales bacterium]|nr:NAD(P)/FAD-dependent oxidoreductase [Bacteroidales bacterium]